MKPNARRFLTCSTAGVFGLSALREALGGSYAAAHALALAGSSAFLLPTLIRNCSWYGPVITRFPTTRREVWLTIDDGPDPAETPGMLEVLARHGAVATFFGIGERILAHPDLARSVLEAGHCLENHTQTHPSASFWIATPGRAQREITACSNAILNVTGRSPRFFRSPVGLANPFVHAATESAGLLMTGWTAAGLDGIPHEPERVVARIMKRVRPGAIILLHEGSLPGMPPGTRGRTLEMLLQRLNNEGYGTCLPAF